MHNMEGDKIYWEKARWELRKNATSYIEQILETTPHESTAIRLLTAHF